VTLRPDRFVFDGTAGRDNDLEIATSGGVPENLVGTLASLPYSIRNLRPRTRTSRYRRTRKSLPLIGLDLVSEGPALPEWILEQRRKLHFENSRRGIREFWRLRRHLGGRELGFKAGDRVPLLINDSPRLRDSRRVSRFERERIRNCDDIATAQQALTRYGRVDRILLKSAKDGEPGRWQQRFAFRASRRGGSYVRKERARTKIAASGGIPMEFCGL